MTICERCGTESPTGFRFCGSCGAPLAVVPPPHADARKVVTALFCDIVESTALGEELDPELLREVIHGYFDAMREAIERYGGTVEKFAGDAVLAVFGVPQVREDDALRAVRAAVEIRERMPLVAERIGVELRCRMGINTGLVVSDQDTLAFGDPVNVAARLEQAARPGEILMGKDTLRLVRHAVEVQPLEPLSLKGKSEPVAAFRLLSVDRAAPSVASQLDVAIVDRERELGVLYETWEATIAERDCHLLTVLGAAGVGKSRLVAELFAPGWRFREDPKWTMSAVWRGHHLLAGRRGAHPGWVPGASSA